MTPIERYFSYYWHAKGILLLVVKWGGCRAFFSTGYHVDKLKFDGMRCTANSMHGKHRTPARIINDALENLEAKVNEAFYSFEITDRMPDKAQLRDAVQQRIGKKSMTMEKAWNEFMIEGESRRQWAYNTAKSVRQVRNLLDKFRPRLRFEDINSELLEEFVEYQTRHKLKNYKPKNPNDDNRDDRPAGYANNVIKKNCRVLKWFLKWAGEKGYLSPDVNALFKVNVKAIERPVVFLTWEELMKVYKADLTEQPHLEASRDVFCLCCFTSLRYSDVSALMKSQVYENWITVTTKKTAVNLRIELNKYSRAILDKYRDLEERAVPFVDLCKFNKDLKILGKLCGIDEPVSISQFYGAERRVVTKPKYAFLSTHCGRRTFICNALALGIPPHVVMKWTGHSEYSAMKPYIDVADNLRVESMSKFDEL